MSESCNFFDPVWGMSRDVVAFHKVQPYLFFLIIIIILRSSWLWLWLYTMDSNSHLMSHTTSRITSGHQTFTVFKNHDHVCDNTIQMNPTYRYVDGYKETFHWTQRY